MATPPQPPRAVLLQGNEAVAEGAIAAGARFFAGYPITPSTEIAEVLSRRLPEVGGTFIQMEDEIASIAAVCGASLAGAKALTATSGPGFSLMQEMIGFATMAQIPCVIVDVMRGGPSTGLPTEPAQGDVMQARWGTHGEHSVIALVPSSVEECYTLTVEAFNLSEQYRTPVIILSDALIGHMREAVVLPEPGDACASPSAACPTASRTSTTRSPVLWTTSCRGRRWAQPFKVHVTGLVYNRQQRHPRHGRPGRCRRPRSVPAREDLPPPRRHRARGGDRDGRTPRSPSSPTAPSPARRMAVVRWARARGVARRPGTARSPCGPFRRRRPWTAWRSRCVRSSFPR